MNRGRELFDRQSCDEPQPPKAWAVLRRHQEAFGGNTQCGSKFMENPRTPWARLAPLPPGDAVAIGDRCAPGQLVLTEARMLPGTTESLAVDGRGCLHGHGRGHPTRARVGDVPNQAVEVGRFRSGAAAGSPAITSSPDADNPREWVLSVLESLGSHHDRHTARPITSPATPIRAGHLGPPGCPATRWGAPS